MFYRSSDTNSLSSFHQNSHKAGWEMGSASATGVPPHLQGLSRWRQGQERESRGNGEDERLRKGVIGMKLTGTDGDGGEGKEEAYGDG